MSIPVERRARLPVYAVAELAALKRRMLADGRDVIDLSVGDAELPPPDVAVDALHRAAAKPRMSRYGFQMGLVAYREAIAGYMERRFGVVVDPITEVLPLLGSKEGLAHLPFAVTNPGDVCVLPEPGYPPYIGGAVLAGTDVELYPLKAAESFLVELDRVVEDRLARTRLVYLNYPNNPTTAVAPREYLERVVALCRRRDITIAFDNPYCELTFDGYEAPSILEIDGARECALEFHSLSKSFGMTGWRLGWAVGGAGRIEALSRVKDYVDTGPFLAVQAAGARVLDSAEELIPPLRRTFAARRDACVAALREAGIQLEAPRATMYVWVPVPRGCRSAELGRKLLEEEELVVVPGSAFGAGGEGYFRVALTVGPERLAEAGARIGRTLERIGVVGARA